MMGGGVVRFRALAMTASVTTILILFLMMFGTVAVDEESTIAMETESTTAASAAKDMIKILYCTS
jgi:hypothetical protein